MAEDQRQNRRGAPGQYDEEGPGVEYRAVAQGGDPGRNDQDSLASAATTEAAPERCRTTSNSVTAAAAETLRELTRPCIGIFARSSHLSNTPGRIPLPSPPSTTAMGPRKSSAV